MDDKRCANPISLWCYAKEPGKEHTADAPVPCRKDACERYRAQPPSCVHMERREKHGFIIADHAVQE